MLDRASLPTGDAAPPLPSDRAGFVYPWPYPGALSAPAWQSAGPFAHRVRAMPETREELRRDSRWPAFFPSPLCIATTHAHGEHFVEKVVGASIVNRFPYVIMLSFCREPLSERHYVRRTFMDAVEVSGRVAVQFIMPGPQLQSVMDAINSVPEDRQADRFRSAGLPLRPTSDGLAPAPAFRDAYLVYEGRLVRSGRDFEGAPINDQPWIDVGSHRLYFFEVETIALRDEIASGRKPLHWRSLPVWRDGPAATAPGAEIAARRCDILSRTGFVKSYQPDYVFPGPGTIAFEADQHRDGLVIKHLPSLPEDQVEVDNDRARWPCFFPSSLGMITVQDRQGRLGGMSCGSTTMVARHPLTVAICVSYARINERYAPRASLDLLTNADRFGCGAPVYRRDVLDAISYLGNVSGRTDPDKVECCGLTPVKLGGTIGFAELPIHFDCRIVGSMALGTHRMFLGEVERVAIHGYLTERNPLEWCPWAGSVAP